MVYIWGTLNSKWTIKLKIFIGMMNSKIDILKNFIKEINITSKCIYYIMK